MTEFKFIIYTVLLSCVLNVRGGFINYFVFDTQDKVVAIFCEGDAIESLRPINSTTFPDQVTINKCPLPRKSYIASLRDLNIEMSAVQTMSITFVEYWSLLTQEHVEDLMLNNFDVRTSNIQMEFLKAPTKAPIDLSKGISITIDCYGGESLDDFPKFPKSQASSFNYSKINFCPPPKDTGYFSTLTAMNINASSINSLSLYDVSNKTKLSNDHLQNFSCKHLWIHQLTSSDDKFLAPLTSLKSLEIGYSNIPPIPQQVKLEKLSLNNGKSKGALGNCEELKTLHLFEWFLPITSRESELVSCPILTELSVGLYYLTDVERHLAGLKNLTKLVVSRLLDVELELPTYLFENLKDLRQLGLTRNNLFALHRDIFKSQTLLETLDLSNNKLTSLSLQRSLVPLRSLRKLMIWRNPLVEKLGEDTVCQSIYPLFGPTKPQLEVIYIIIARNLTAVNCTSFYKTWTPVELPDNNNRTEEEEDISRRTVKRRNKGERTIAGNWIQGSKIEESRVEENYSLASNSSDKLRQSSLLVLWLYLIRWIS